MKEEDLIAIENFSFAGGTFIPKGSRFKFDNSENNKHWGYDVYEKTAISKTHVRTGSCLIWDEEQLEPYKAVLKFESELK